MEKQTLADRLLQHTVHPTSNIWASDYSPEDIRLACQDLISRGYDTLAIAVGEAAYALYPKDQDILVITALMAITDKDWGLAIERMSELVALQGVMAKEFTYLLLARAQRSDLDPAGAIKTLHLGLSAYPKSEDLKAELKDLMANAGAAPSDADESLN